MRRALHRSEEHTSELQSRSDLVYRLLLEKKKNTDRRTATSQESRCGAATLLPRSRSFRRVCFFFSDTATTEIYTLPLHDALPIWMVLMPLLSRLLTLLVILTMPLFLARLTLIPIKSLSICFRVICISITTILKRRGCLTVPRLIH